MVLSILTSLTSQSTLTGWIGILQNTQEFLYMLQLPSTDISSKENLILVQLYSRLPPVGQTLAIISEGRLARSSSPMVPWLIQAIVRARPSPQFLSRPLCVPLRIWGPPRGPHWSSGSSRFGLVPPCSQGEYDNQGLTLYPRPKNWPLWIYLLNTIHFKEILNNKS